MSFEKDNELTHKIIDLIDQHFRDTGKVLSQISFKWDMKALKDDKVILTQWTRRWKYKGEKR